MVHTFGIRRNEKMAVHITIHEPKAEEIEYEGVPAEAQELLGDRTL